MNAIILEGMTSHSYVYLYVCTTVRTYIIIVVFPTATLFYIVLAVL
jgi:hypothetical protein